MISIIIPAYNLHEMTRDCINAVRQHTDDCEIILVDNGSEPAYTAPFTGFIPCRVIRNETNLGFPAAVNQGIAAAEGDVIVLLNNDVTVTPGWSEVLLAALDAGFDIVGPLTNRSAGHQAIQAPTYENEAELAKVAAEIAQEIGDDVQPVKWIIGFCMAFRKRLAEEIGEFDTSIWPCSGEEIDFCLRAVSKGYRVGIARGAYVHHEANQTFEAMMSTEEYNALTAKTAQHLVDRWGPEALTQRFDANVLPHGLCLNLGCGYRRLTGFVNIDNRPEVTPDIVCDVTDGLPYADRTVDLVRADDFLEHVPQEHVMRVMTDIWRVLKADGTLDASVPSTDGRGAFQDPTHRSWWNRNTWLYFSDIAYRQLYGTQADFEIISLTENAPGEDGIIHTHVIARARK